MNKDIPKFLIDSLVNQYGYDLTEQIIKGFNDRCATFRVNTLKSNVEEVLKALKENNIEVLRVPWNLSAFVIKNQEKVNIKELDIYKNGKIYLQSLSSMLPVLVLDPKENDHILDMTAAPGSKTTQIASITNNNARITACEKNKIRCDRLKYNLALQGVTCCTIINEDACKLDDLFSFDKILLDAPCSGSGTVNLNNISEKNLFNKENLEKINSTQLSLLKKAIKLLKKNQTMVYSTCSILSSENEDIIEKAMKEFDITIVPIKLDNSIPILPTKIEGTICVCPNELFEGFFMALIRKNS